jgi:two-component system, OmpR family, alkaline phosphatase synthesis response regulator PhoP
MEQTKKVLLVDDSEFTLLMETMILQESPDFRLITAMNGAEAVRIALKERPALILMDVVMPRMDGVQACRAIRSSADNRQVPIILVSARGEKDDVIEGYASGCTGYLTKPINPQELVALVEQHLGKECPALA